MAGAGARQQRAAHTPPLTLRAPTRTRQAQASGNLHIATWKDAQSTVRSFVSNNIWRAPIAACALGGLMVVLFNLMSCVVLLRKSIARKAGAGFGYGACQAGGQAACGRCAVSCRRASARVLAAGAGAPRTCVVPRDARAAAVGTAQASSRAGRLS